MTSYGRFPVQSAEEASELISHGATLGIGGFTDPGCPKAVPTALARRARGFHERGEPFRVRILSGAEAGPAVDVDLPQADAVSFRMPYQGEKTCREAINERKCELISCVRHADDECNRRFRGLRAECTPFGVCLSLDRQGGENLHDRSLL